MTVLGGSRETVFQSRCECMVSCTVGSGRSLATQLLSCQRDRSLQVSVYGLWQHSEDESMLKLPVPLKYSVTCLYVGHPMIRRGFKWNVYKSSFWCKCMYKSVLNHTAYFSHIVISSSLGCISALRLLIQRNPCILSFRSMTLRTLVLSRHHAGGRGGFWRILQFYDFCTE